MNEGQVRLCPLCKRDNSDRPTLPASRDGWRLVACHECDLIYLENPVSYDQLEDEVAWTRTFEAERARRRKSEPVFSWFSSHYKRIRLRYFYRNKALQLIEQTVPQGDILDVGCGNGRLLSQLPETLRPLGIEIDVRAAEQARKVVRRRDGQIWQADALTGLGLLDADQLDGVVMQSFLEHEVQPVELLAAVARIIKPGGSLILKVPNIGCWNHRLRRRRWCGYRFPDHVNYYTPQTLLATVTAAGFQVARFTWRDCSPLSDNMWLVATPAESVVEARQAA